MFKFKLSFISLIVFILSNVLPVHSSLFSTNGFGEIIHPVDIRGRGMGCTGISSGFYTYTTNVINPANIYGNNLITVSAIYLPEAIFYKNNVYSSRETDSNFPQIVMTIPIVKNFTVGMALLQRTTLSFDVSQDFNSPVKYTESVIGEGGIYSFSGLIGIKPHNFFAIGAEFGRIFGSTNEKWTYNFNNVFYYNTNNKIETDYSGINYGVGILLFPMQELKIGFVFKDYKNIDGKVITGSELSSKEEIKSFTFPKSIGGGISYSILPTLTMAGDVYFTSWSDFEISNKSLSFIDVYRYGIGVEYYLTKNKLRPYYEKLPIRFGYYRQPLYQRDIITHNEVNEQFLTMGTELPFSKNIGTMNISIEYGMRGNIPETTIEENIFRFGFQISGWEKWGMRR